METAEEYFAKQYNKRKNYEFVQPYPALCQRQCEEPIDLTQGPSRSMPTEPQPFNKHKNRRPRMLYPPNVLDQQGGLFKDVIELQATESKQTEILKAAKSLFSKRTRTLYHWMYPNTPKQQIKLAVANSWDNLGAQEKQFYISQVLVRFGFPQSNLMVNPQLGGIKELPPLPDTIEESFSSSELQNAISSISGYGSGSCEGRKRQGRPPGSKNKKLKSEPFTYKISKDFQDDPELSKELEKFAISFDCFK